ncbi:Senescence associated gene 20-like protein [Drosera capensis]
MRLLTGEDTVSDSDPDSSFVFAPVSVAAFGNTVLAEGCDTKRGIYWVHAWTVCDGIITQVREYFNTSVTVTRLGVRNIATAAASSSTKKKISGFHCQPVWESRLSNRAGKSVPGLVLAL